MSAVNNRCLKKWLILLAMNSALFTLSANANEWRDTYEAQTGFSDFSPPKSFSGSNNNDDQKEWASGRSFNQGNKVRYSPRVSKNPWKLTSSSHYKKTFGSKRPWGNIPDKKPKTSNMRLHDERFKQWSRRQDSSFRNIAGHSNPLMTGGLFPLSYSGYGYSGSIYNSPLITPSIYPGQMLSPLGNGLGSIGAYPYTGLFARPGLW